MKNKFALSCDQKNFNLTLMLQKAKIFSYENAMQSSEERLSLAVQSFLKKVKSNL